jgi:CheY-like chemotaxis protein
MSAEPTVHILVVEDNLDGSFLLTRQLARAQMEHSVTVIGNGQDALDWLLSTAYRPAAVFVDLRLPGLSGLDLVRKMKQDLRLRVIPVIIMTASVDPADVEECTKLGVSAYLPKPVALSTFLKILVHLSPK